MAKAFAKRRHAIAISVPNAASRMLWMADLPEDYRVVGAEHRTPLVRKPSGQIIRIKQNGRMTAATTVARRRLAAVARQRIASNEGDA